MALTKAHNRMIDSVEVNAKDFGAVGNGSTDDTTAIQAAMDFARDNNLDLYIPAGVYVVTGLTIPGIASDSRSNAFRIYGQGTGEALSQTNTGGTVLLSTTNAPVLQDILDTDPSSNGSIRIEFMRLDGTSSTAPVLKLQSFFGLSKLSNVVVRQRGVGDGVYIGWSALIDVSQCFVWNKDAFSVGLGASRVGTAWKFLNTWDGALIKLSQCSARGFKTGFTLDSATNSKNYISSKLTDCQCSVLYNGIEVLGGNAWTITNLYVEGLEGGTAVLDEGNYTRVENCFIGPGYLVGVDGSNNAKKGNVYANNLLSSGSIANAVSIDVAVGTNGHKKVLDNTIISSAAIAGAIGLRLSGTDYQLDVRGNTFEPNVAWSGSGAQRIDNNTTGARGFMQAEYANDILPVLASGVVTFSDATITDADVTSNALSLPTGTYFEMSASGSTTVQSINPTYPDPVQLIIMRLTDSNVTIQDTARISLDTTDGNFTGIGTIGFIVKRIGSLFYAYELYRRTL
tara:strand:- start:208 stop:1743 length:1536 start_codon:yes stop_codon:yes gene_type:complete